MLDRHGIVLAIIMGIIISIAGGMEYLVLILAFFTMAVLVTKHQHFRKKEFGIYEHERSWENVLSNGILPAILAVISPYTGPMPFIGAVSAITADKFASELGVLSGEPISLENLKPTQRGKSGAVSVFGTVMSLAGGVLIGIFAITLFGLTPTAALMIGIIGLFGSIVDSIFGVFEERGIGNKSTTNIICSVTGAIGGYYFIVL